MNCWACLKNMWLFRWGRWRGRCFNGRYDTSGFQWRWYVNINPEKEKKSKQFFFISPYKWNSILANTMPYSIIFCGTLCTSWSRANLKMWQSLWGITCAPFTCVNASLPFFSCQMLSPYLFRYIIITMTRKQLFFSHPDLFWWHFIGLG